MTDVEREFETHAKFEAVEEGYAPTTNDWTATATVADGRVRVSVTLPTLSAAVADAEDVAPVVEDGWFETLERRLADATNVTRTDAVEKAAVERDGDVVRFEAAIDARSGDAPGDALAVVNYVEGTWFEGIVPGYDYRSDVRELRERAAGRGRT